MFENGEEGRPLSHPIAQGLGYIFSPHNGKEQEKEQEQEQIDANSDPIVVLTHVNNLLNKLLKSMESVDDVDDEYFKNLKFEIEIKNLKTKFTPENNPTDNTPNILKKDYLKKLNQYLLVEYKTNIFDIYKALLLKYSS